MLGYLARLWVPLGFFLILDFNKSYGEVAAGLPFAGILANFGVVTLLALLASLPVAGLWMLAERRLGLHRAVGDLALFSATFWVNVLYLRFRALVALAELNLPTRWGLVFLAVVLGVVLFLGLRRKWRSILDEVDRDPAFLLIPVGCAAGLSLFGLVSRPEPPASPAEAPPSIVFITLDSLSSRHLGCYGYSRPTSPNLDKLASESVVVLGMHSNSNTTITAMPAFQGYYRMARLPGKSLSQTLAEHGYTHLWFVSSGDSKNAFLVPPPLQTRVVNAFHGTWLYRRLAAVFPSEDLRWLSLLATREFLYYNPFHPYVHLDRHYTREHAPADLTLRAGLELLERHPRGTFLWMHLWIPHFPYLPKPPYLGRFNPDPAGAPPFALETDPPRIGKAVVERLRDRYDEYILMADAQVGGFLDELKARRLYDRCVLVVSADHGESFDAGAFGHGGPMNSEGALSVPLILKLPGVPPARLDTFAEAVDLAPTLLDYLKIPIPPQMHGESLLPYLAGGRSTKPKLSVSYSAYYEGRGEVSVYWKKYKLTYPREDPSRHRLIDLAADPGETTDVSHKQPELVEKLKQVVRF